MGTPNLPRLVKANDLILFYPVASIRRPRMLLVMSAPDTHDPQASLDRIFVREVKWAPATKPDRWILDGPRVYYVAKTTDNASEGDTYRDWPDDKAIDTETIVALKEILISPFCLGAKGCTPGHDIVIVNPHGRDVLRYYFDRCCRICGSKGWICPRCDGYSEGWPDLRESCGLDEACPVCQGQDFARDEMRMLEELDLIESRLWSYLHPPRSKGHQRISDEEWKREKTLAESLWRVRCAMANEIRAEMGMPPEDVEQRIKRLKEIYFGE